MSNDETPHLTLCKECNKNFSNISNLRTHVKRKHSVDKLEELAPKKKFTPATLCFECGTTFVKKSNLNKHIKNKHADKLDILIPEKIKSEKSIEGFKCTLCSDRHKSRATLISHYVEAHELKIETEQLIFKSFDDFLSWKRKLEEETVSSFVNTHGQHKARNFSKIKYECHRSGEVRSKGRNVRNLKAQGSNKINGHCPAGMTVIVSEDKCEVHFCRTHVGHECELGRLFLSKSERQELAAKIASNVPFSAILEDIKSSAAAETRLQRIHLVSKKDLHNIKQSFKYISPGPEKDDSDNVEMKTEETNLFKPQSVHCLVFHTNSTNHRLIELFKVKFLSSAAPNVSNFEINFKSKFNNIQQEKILSVLNESSQDELLGFNVTQTKIKSLENYKKKRGPFKSFDDLLDVEGLSVKLLEKLCKQIISAETPTQSIVKALNNDKKLKQMLSPTLAPNHNISSAVGIHLATVGVSWAKLHEADSMLETWHYQDFTNLPKKMLPTDTFKLAMDILNQLPASDVYVFEGNSTLSLQGQKQPSTVPSYTQQLELMSMLVALLNTSSQHNISEHESGEEYPNCVHFLRSKLPARLFKTLVGNECVSSTNSVLTLLGDLPADTAPLPYTQVSLADDLKDYYVEQSAAQKELLGQALMLTVAFMDVCVRKTPSSLNAVIPGRK